MAQREHWGSRVGVILAVAGSAVGLGNFLRFPGLVASNGGGAFMIPYFIAFLLLGIPLMWVEWTLGRFGGLRGHGTAPGMFEAISGRRRMKYLGTIGILGPFLILIYYMYIESWAFAYALFSFTRKLYAATDPESMSAFLREYQGHRGSVENGDANRFFSSIGPAYGFFIATFVVNFYFIYRGVRGGIEKLARFAMPALLVIALFLMVRVLTLGTPDAGRPDLSITNGLGFLWNPDFRSLANAEVWLRAAGQIFFTLSVGIGVILTYASYLRKEDDLTLSGLTASATNEFSEVILGASIVIPAAFVFLGPVMARTVSEGSIFNLGFVTMPLIFQQLPLGFLFSGLWFLLLFIAGITSSVSLIQPAVSFFEDELGWSRHRSTLVLAAIAFVGCQPVIFFMNRGFLGELDFWGGNLFLIVFATVEVILFAWVFGMDRGWREMHEGAKLRIPVVYKFIIQYVTPTYLLVLLGVWTYQQFWNTLLMRGIDPSDRPYVWGARLLVFALWAAIILLVRHAWQRRGAARFDNPGSAGPGSAGPGSAGADPPGRGPARRGPAGRGPANPRKGTA